MIVIVVLLSSKVPANLVGWPIKVMPNVMNYLSKVTATVMVWQVKFVVPGEGAEYFFFILL